MTSTRLICISTPSSPIQVPPPPTPASGAKFYNAPGAAIAQGNVLDVAGDETSVDVATLISSGNFVLLGQVGTTSARPTYPRQGQQFIDTTVGTLLTYDGAAWRDVTGTSH
jgi:hypothetical protein